MRMTKKINQCFKCNNYLGGVFCAVHSEIKLHEGCEDFQELLIRLYPKHR